MITKILKGLRLYVPVKRLKDEMTFSRQMKTARPKLYNLYKEFVKYGDLVFDCGGAYGNRTMVFLELGADRVVMVEPLSYYSKIHRKNLGKEMKEGKVIVEKVCLSDKPGTAVLMENVSPSLSTIDMVEKNKLDSDPRMRNLEWLEAVDIEVITLQHLIDKYGKPDFVKIDIEGHDYKAISTLKEPIKALSFEYHTYRMDDAKKAISHLSSLGKYKFNYSTRESFELKAKKWLNEKEIKEVLDNIPEKSDFGDVYAKLE